LSLLLLFLLNGWCQVADDDDGDHLQWIDGGGGRQRTLMMLAGAGYYDANMVQCAFEFNLDAVSFVLACFSSTHPSIAITIAVVAVAELPSATESK
jgi:hypothetical protein